MKLFRCFVPTLLALAPLFAQPDVVNPLKPGRDPNQAIDEEYTRKIREYTTETFFNSPLTDYLPASKTVPTPKAVLGDVSGAPGSILFSGPDLQSPLGASGRNCGLETGPVGCAG